MGWLAVSRFVWCALRIEIRAAAGVVPGKLARMAHAKEEGRKEERRCPSREKRAVIDDGGRSDVGGGNWDELRVPLSLESNRGENARSETDRRTGRSSSSSTTLLPCAACSAPQTPWSTRYLRSLPGLVLLPTCNSSPPAPRQQLTSAPSYPRPAARRILTAAAASDSDTAAHSSNSITPSRSFPSTPLALSSSFSPHSISYSFCPSAVLLPSLLIPTLLRHHRHQHTPARL